MIKQYLIAGLVVLVGLGGWFALSDRGGEQARSGGPRPVFVNTVMPRIEHISDRVDTVGSTLALAAIDVTTEVDGRIVELHFEEGATIVAGAVLVTLDQRQARADLLVAEAQARDAQARFERAQRLRTSSNISAAEYDELDAARQAANARVTAARTRLDMQRVVAPFDGVTGLREASLGAYIKAGDRITTLDSVDPIEVLFAIPERYVGILEHGLPVQALSDAFPDHTFVGTIASLATRVDAIGRNLRVKAQLSNKEGRLRPGQFMTVRLILREREALLIPEEALVTRGDQQRVFVEKDGRAEARDVRVGLRRDGAAEITEGLDPHDAIIVNGQARLRDGDLVQVLDDPDPLVSGERRQGKDRG